MKSKAPVIIILGVFLVAIGAFWYARRSTSPQASSSSARKPYPASSVAYGTPGAEPAHILGAANAPAHIEEFGDFECPPCGLFHPILKQLKSEFGDKLKVTFRHFPLKDMHPHAIGAASAAESAGMQGKFWEMHALLYENQNSWKTAFDVRPIFEGYAKQLGLDLERYKQDVNSNVAAERIFLDQRRGQSLGVKGTPTVFLNGREIPFEALPPEKLRVLINQAISDNQ